MKFNKILSLVVFAFSITSQLAMELPKNYRKPLPPIPAKPAAATPVQIEKPTSTNDSTNATQVVLTYKQEESVKKIIKDINKIAENSLSISRNGIQLGKTASLSNIVSNTKETAIILAKLAQSSALIADIYLEVEKLSHASTEAKSLARKRILAVFESPDFKHSEAQLIALAGDASLPQAVRVPLQKFASQIAELPAFIVKKYLGAEAPVLEAK